MIDEIPIIGITEWTVDGLAAKEFSQKGWGTGHRLDGVQASRVEKGRVGDRARQPNSFDFEPTVF